MQEFTVLTGIIQKRILASSGEEAVATLKHRIEEEAQSINLGKTFGESLYTSLKNKKSDFLVFDDEKQTFLYAEEMSTNTKFYKAPPMRLVEKFRCLINDDLYLELKSLIRFHGDGK